jgi:hypothetical protein
MAETDCRAAAVSTCLSGLCMEAAVVTGAVGRQDLATFGHWSAEFVQQRLGVLQVGVSRPSVNQSWTGASRSYWVDLTSSQS